jgi:hypothetical protein
MKPHARPQVDRRAVVRVGVWTVPVVTMAAAAPALAAASVTAGGTLKFNSLNLYGADYNRQGKPTTAESQTSVQSLWTAGGPTLTGVTLIVTYSGSRVDGSAPTLVSGTGWSFGSASPSGSDWLYSFTWTGSLPTSGSTSTLTWRVPLKNNSSGHMGITAHASGPGVTPADAAASTNL